VPDGTTKVTVVVTGGPEGRKAERRWRFAVRDGAVVEAAEGAFADDEAHLVITQPWDDAVAAIDGSVPLDEAFMRGTTKVVGSTGILMDLLPVLRSDQWRTACAPVAAPS
jgi:hypothetical protein